MLHYNDSWVTGSAKHKTSSAVDHAKFYLHEETLTCYYDDLKKKKGQVKKMSLPKGQKTIYQLVAAKPEQKRRQLK